MLNACTGQVTFQTVSSTLSLLLTRCLLFAGSAPGDDVNDTISGDPVFSVPILVSDEELQTIPAEKLSLCYVLHGRQNKWFNLVSDECTSISSHYTGLGAWLNVINEIAITAIDSQNQCVNISVSVGNSCSAVVNGENLETRQYSSGRVDVRTYTNRVRISVPNCNDRTLVMWVFCEHQNLQVSDEPVTSPNSIKFVIMRGLNYGHRMAHGLVGRYLV